VTAYARLRLVTILFHLSVSLFCPFFVFVSVFLLISMTSPMDFSIPNHLNSTTSPATNPQNYEDNPQRPHKVQKLSTPTHGFAGDILNIPVFMGTPPRFPSQQNQQEEHLHHQSNNYQEQGNSPQESPRMNPHHNNNTR
jgi:hypothetical protein